MHDKEENKNIIMDGGHRTHTSKDSFAIFRYIDVRPMS